LRVFGGFVGFLLGFLVLLGFCRCFLLLFSVFSAFCVFFVYFFWLSDSEEDKDMSLVLLEAFEEDYHRVGKVAHPKSKGKRELLNFFF
jgi:hypothetical protein